MTDQSITRRNIGVLTAAQALGGASAPIVMSLGGLVGQQLAKDSAWITLPVSLFGLGLAIGTLPAAFIMRRHGRRNGYVVGVGFGVASGLIEPVAAVVSEKGRITVPAPQIQRLTRLVENAVGIDAERRGEHLGLDAVRLADAVTDDARVRQVPVGPGRGRGGRRDLRHRPDP